jgi:uncharacterized protein (DUF779 family)
MEANLQLLAQAETWDNGKPLRETLVADVAAEDDDYLDKALEGFAMFALNQGEVCTYPSRALVQEKIYDRGGMFSLDNGREKRFLVRSDVCHVP